MSFLADSLGMSFIPPVSLVFFIKRGGNDNSMIVISFLDNDHFSILDFFPNFIFLAV